MPHPIPAVLALSAALLLPLTVAAPAEAAEVVTVTHTAPAAAPAAVARHSHHWLHCHTRTRPCAVPRPAPRVTNARAKVLRVAASYRGVPYVYGGTTRRGVDCSGYVGAVYREAIHKTLPRTVSALRRIARITRRPAIGDIVFYSGGGHVALVAAVSHGKVTNTWVARHTGTRVQMQVPYTAYVVGSVIT